ncbi:MAG: hypothetical protein NC300_07800 [Bacteroidales bacterium]|nr:hypothetical protein [Clostridium sp.]MCM1204033.1 hypothetical protein [Bacteroidales bacterium]
MPNINRIRVNNVKYNFGTQSYDDFSMRMYGKNTLYDLANGGGKSVLMLLLLQNLIPNCTLDEKQPVEKLFRNGGGNTTIHSLVEWKLDDKDIKEGFRYMTTGFCARKAKEKETADGGQIAMEAADAPVSDTAKDTGAGGKDSASIEYFNYCIFYREYNDNDIVNLPLQNSRERITYTGLKNYLKELGRRNLNLKVFVFERKGEYQRFISGYGLFESQWEIIRGINKTEGHVRTYFETHYKTTRKVIEDLLIEEIIEKAFLVKTEQDDVNEDMAKTLLDIKDKLVELSRKKSEIANYDRETELMHLLEGRVSSFLSLYEERDRVTGTLGDIYVTGEALSRQGEEEIAKMEEKKAEMERRLLQERRRLEGLKIVEDRYELERIREELGVLERHVAKADEELNQAKAELDLKESVNDYLRYLEDRAQMEENRAAIDASEDTNSDQLEKLHRYAYTKKQMDDEKLRDSRSRLENRKKELAALEEELETLTHIDEEATVALAVARSHKERFAEEYFNRMEEIRAVRREISILVLSDLTELSGQLKEEEEELRQKKEAAEAAYMADIREGNEKERLLYVENEEWKMAEKALEEAEEKHREYLANRDRLKKMVQIYGVKDAAALYDTIKERAFRHRVAAAGLEKEINRVKRHLEQVKEGRILEESEAVSRVKDYLESRHGDFALSGVDYLSALPKANREELLIRFPMLPYGVVTKQFGLLKEDERIGTIDLENQMVPVFDWQMLEAPYIPDEQEGILLIAKDKTLFLEEDALATELSRLEKKLAEMQEEAERLDEMSATYDEDLDYTAKLTASAFLHAENEMQERKEAVLEHKRAAEKLVGEVERIKAHGEKQQEEARKLEDLLQNNQKEQIKLAGIEAVSNLADETKKQLDFYEAEVKRLEKDTAKAASAKEEAALKKEELSNQILHMEEQLQEVLSDWENIYKAYYTDEKFTAVNLSEEQLRAEFLAAKGVVEQAAVVLEDKKKLIAALQESMERGLKVIRRRKVDLGVLEQLRESNELHPVKEEWINRLSMHLSRITAQTEQLRDELKKKEHEATRLEGRIEQAVQGLKERFGEEAVLEIDSLLGLQDDSADEGKGVTKEEAVQAIAEGGRILNTLQEEINAFRREYQQYVKNNGVILDLYKDVKRIVEGEELDTANAEVLVKEQEEIREIFEESLFAFDRSKKALTRAKQELLGYKTQTANTFFTMGAFALADSVRDDVEVPETYEEAKALLENIREMIAFIALEKERVEQGIEDMEAIKNNFENQCIERCRDVRTELEKLPKLSRIQLDGEAIQMVSLAIPYVKEEFIKQRMSDYIDEVVNGADRFTDNRERMKYMKDKLLLKKLFGVMVKDMNSIKLKLYKRERMKEQSRYLRYEEAVGSTGQSQGIYIQFLVAIINYISGMYAPGVEAAELKKVIFIDNPFGAAKDIYIWEPIFAMLKTNNVQLIVPARGATPAITSRFDVNYILGQQLAGDRQQTVVVDYRSQVAQEEIEYEELEYSQAAFDFL